MVFFFFFLHFFLFQCLNRLDNNRTVVYVTRDVSSSGYLTPFNQVDSLAASHWLFFFFFCIRERGRSREGERKRGRPLDLKAPPSYFYFPLLPIFTLFLLLLSSSSSPPPLLLLLPVFLLRRDASVPQFEETVPGSCADAHTVLRNAGAAHPVVVAGQHTWRRRRGRKEGRKVRRGEKRGRREGRKEEERKEEGR